jgi:hypothetical protein
MSDLKTYEKWYVKKNYATNKVEEKDGNPVLGEFIRTCRLTSVRAETFNQNWRETGQFLAEQKDEKIKSAEVPAGSSALDDLRSEAKELGIKGAHIMKEETLLAKINEKKGE